MKKIHDEQSTCTLNKDRDDTDNTFFWILNACFELSAN